MNFYGWKCYFQIQKPDSTYLAKYPIRKLPSSMTYEPQRRYYRRAHQPNIDIERWRVRLGFPTIEVTKATLAHNTNMVQTL